MKSKSTYYILLILSVFLLSCQQKTDSFQVTFELKTPTPLDSGEMIFIAGNREELGLWDPTKVQLEQIDETHWELVSYFIKNDILEYKFTKGSWNTEAADARGRPLQNFGAVVKNDTIIQHEILFWRDGTDLKPEGQITGNVKYHKNVSGKGLKNRDLIVWLPPQYERNNEQRFPVLYMHDGQNIFDPNTSSFKVDWQLDETIDSLIRNQIIEPIIVVGLYNTTDRTLEYSPGELGNYYMDFLTKKVMKLIDSTYRTKPGKEFTFVGGSSMGGLISFMLAWEYDDLFGGAMCMSPAFKIQEFDYVDDVLGYNGPKKDISLYIDNGGIGLEEELQPGIDEMLEALSARGYSYTWVKELNDRHFEAAWAGRTSVPLITFYGNDKINK